MENYKRKITLISDNLKKYKQFLTIVGDIIDLDGAKLALPEK